MCQASCLKRFLAQIIIATIAIIIINGDALLMTKPIIEAINTVTVRRGSQWRLMWRKRPNWIHPARGRARLG